MSELRLDEYMMPSAGLGPPSPLVPFRVDTANLVTKENISPDVPEEETRYIGYGYVDGCLPYLVQDSYDRQRRPRAFRTAVLENDWLKATFLLELGGRLWSLVYKAENRELLFVNPVFQPANLGIRDAWFSGGAEWNFCWIGHTPLTCSPLFAARAAGDDGTPVLRLWEWERVRQMAYQIDAWLGADSPVLFVRVRLANLDDRTVPVYWWSNIAVEERPDVRVLAPADTTYNFGYRSGKMGRVSFPYRNGRDMSYPTNSPHSGDYFFRIPSGQYPWVASVGGDGAGFFHSSTARLFGRKVWVFGSGAGGRRWQEFLNPGRAYIEIQGGLARTQSECLPLPPKTEWEWLEAYGPVRADAKTVHGSDWPAAWGEVQRQVGRFIPQAELDGVLDRSRAMARRRPLEILHRGSGWGALERLRREKAGEDPAAPESVVFDDESLTDEQAPWLELLRTGRLPEAPPSEPPGSYMVQDQWCGLLERSVAAGPSDHWLGWLHLGLMYLQQKRFDDARRAWEKSLAHKPSAWAYRHLAALAALLEDYERASRLYPQAVSLAPEFVRLVVECGRSLLAAGHPRPWLDLLETLPPHVRRLGRIRLMEGQAALAIDDLDRIPALLGKDLLVADLREGERATTQLWYDYQERRVSKAEGAPIDEALKERVRREFPPPAHLDFRMG